MSKPKQNRACAYLVTHGAHGWNPNHGRKLCADAIREGRDQSPAQGRWVAGMLSFISGCLPQKEVTR